MNTFEDNELRAEMENNDATWVRHIDIKHRAIHSALLIKANDALALTIKGVDFQIKAGLFAHEGVMIFLTMIKIGDWIIDNPYNLYGEQKHQLIVLLDLHNQEELPVHFLSPKHHTIIVCKNTLKKPAERLISLSNMLPPWTVENWKYALLTFYSHWDNNKELWNKIALDNDDNDLILKSTRIDHPPYNFNNN